MYFKSKKTSLLILGTTSLVLSRTFFLYIDDPEGPNLLIVTVLALVLYSLSLLVYIFNFSVTALQRLLLAILIQALVVTGLCFWLS